MGSAINFPFVFLQIIFDISGNIRNLLESAGIPAEKIGRISISLPGSVNAEGKVLRCTRLHWRNYDLKKELSAWYGVPIDINNDVNLALIAEQRFGKGQNCGNLVYLHLGEGIGCGEGTGRYCKTDSVPAGTAL